jgi:hypothetical protein
MNGSAWLRRLDQKGATTVELPARMRPARDTELAMLPAAERSQAGATGRKLGR